tara:strand:- start:2958 stop:3359 length:402 start_codon:yes stop_codon:yes gene_type:complete
MNIKIGELALLTDCQTVTIRYYEKEGLLPKPMRSGGNFRLYGQAHVERLNFIRRCRSLGMTLIEVRVLLQYRDTPDQDCSEINALLDKHIQHLETRVEELSQLRRNLVALREKCAGEQTTVSCGILQGLSERS